MKSAYSKKKNKATKNWLLSAVLGLLGLVVVIVGIELFSNEEAAQKKSGMEQAKKANVVKKEKPKKETAKKAKVVKEVVAEVKSEKVAQEDTLTWDDSFVTNREMRIKFSVLVSATTNDSGLINERYKMPNGKYWRRQIDPPPIFENASDNAIAMALGDRSGAPIPHYPGWDDLNLDEEFIKSLSKPIVINEKDKPWLVALKMTVAETRKEIESLIKSGDKRSVGEILRDHVYENNRSAELQGEAIKAYDKILKEEGSEAATEYLEKVNESLERFGVSPIKKRK